MEFDRREQYAPVIVTVLVSEDVNIIGRVGTKATVYTREVYAGNDWGSNKVSEFVEACKRRGSPFATHKRVSVWVAPTRTEGYNPQGKAVALWKATHVHTGEIVTLEAHYLPHKTYRKWYLDGTEVNKRDYALISPGA